MPQIKVDTGGSTFNIEVPNFATEETLRDLLNAFTGTSSKSARGRKAEEAEIKSSTKSISDFGDQIDLTSDDIEQSGSRLGETFNRAGDRLSDAVNRAAFGFENLTGGTSESGRALEKTTSTFADLASKALDGIDSALGSIGGPITSAISGAITGGLKFVLQAGSALVGFYVGQMEGLRAQQRDFYDSGVFFTNGIDDAAKTAGQAGVTLGDLAAASKDAKDSLRFMSGGSAGGLQQVSKVFGNFTKAQRENLYALGYTNEEVMSALADMGASAAQAGQQLNFEDMQAAAVPYLKNLKEMSRISGENIKDLRAQQEAHRRDLFVQNQLLDLAPAQRAATESFVTQLPKALQGFALSGQAFDSSTAYIANTALPSYAQGVKGILDQLKSGTIDQTEAQKQYESLLRDPQVAQEIKNNTRLLGQAPAEMMGSASTLATTLGELDASLKGQISASNATGNALSPEGTLNKGMAQFVDINTKMNTALQQTALGLTEKMVPAIDFVVSGILELAKKLPGGVSEATQSQMDTGTVRQLAAALTEVGQSQTFGSTSEQGRALSRMSDAQLAAMGLERQRRVMQGGPRSGGAVSYEVKRTRAAQPQNQALGGIIPHMDAEGTLIRAGEKQNEAVVPLPDGRAIPVKIDGTAFRDMNDKLDLLARINGAMLAAMESNNRLTRQGVQLAS